MFLAKRRAWGYCLAPMLLTTVIAIGLGIVTGTMVIAERGLDPAWPKTVVIAAITLVEAVVLGRFLRSTAKEG